MFPSITMRLYDKKTNFIENYCNVHKEITDWEKTEDEKYRQKYLKYKSKYLLLKKKL